MNKGIIIIASILTLLFSVESLAKANNHRILAEEYIQLSKVKETFDTTIEANIEQTIANRAGANKDKIRSYFQSIMGWDVMKEATITIVMNHFTAKELKAINEFYKTDVGKTFANESPAMAADLSKTIAQNLNAVTKQSKP